MDGITEPVVLILGHPIAGNPSQFALERAIASMDLQWRVLSCDVPADQVDQAIAGAEVLGFRGLLLDRNLIAPADDAQQHCDLYFRDTQQSDGWQSDDLLRVWLDRSIHDHFASLEQPIGNVLSIGAADASVPYELAENRTQSPIAWASADDVEKAQWIVMTEPIEINDWPTCEDAATLVVDLANPPNDVDAIRSKGYVVLSREEARIGILMACLQRLTGKLPDQEILTDAIEEYLAV